MLLFIAFIKLIYGGGCVCVCVLWTQIIMALEEDPAGQKMQLGYRLQQVAALVENKVTDLWTLTLSDPWPRGGTSLISVAWLTEASPERREIQSRLRNPIPPTPSSAPPLPASAFGGVLTKGKRTSKPEASANKQVFYHRECEIKKKHI